MRKEIFIEITTCCGSFLCQIESEISRTRDVSQWEGRFQKRIYIKSNIIKMVLCQIINCLRFQIFICHFVALFIGIDYGK